jgi:MFS family permease
MYTGLLLTRFFLGIAEAPFYPGALYMLSIYYTRREIATRISILFTGNIFATAFAGLIAIGVFEMSGVAGISGWRWLYILQGALTFVISIMALFILPDDPLKTWWLTEEERQLAHHRISGDTVGYREQTSAWAGLREACADAKLWLFVAMQFM